jgi:REP element-mobilizing transposase RayT
MIVKGEPAVYHLMSRTALDGFVLGDVEKEYLLKLIKRLSSIYFTEILGFCLMGNHFHILVKMIPGKEYSDEIVKTRYKRYYGKDKQPGADQISLLRQKWSSLSEYVKEIKQTFSRYYNKSHGRRGFFWSDRFKSVIVENGQTLINCLAYIDLNPIRAGIVEKPEDYRWNSIGYHVQTNNKDDFLSLDFGLKEFNVLDADERLRLYRKFLYEKGSNTADKGSQIAEKTVEKEKKRGFKISQVDRFRYRTRYFSDSGIIGTKEFVAQNYQRFKHHFQSKKEKIPKLISGLDGVYSLKRLSAI